MRAVRRVRRAEHRTTYSFDLIDPRDVLTGDAVAPHVDSSVYARGWTLTMYRPFATERDYAKSLGTPLGAWLTWFDPSWFAKTSQTAWGRSVEPGRIDRGKSHWLYGWLDVRTGQGFFPDEQLKRAGLATFLVYEQEMLPFARKHPPFVRRAR